MVTTALSSVLNFAVETMSSDCVMRLHGCLLTLLTPLMSAGHGLVSLWMDR